jgi:phosphoribosylaminoimidazole-succinocarboxamide synthase
MSLLAESYLRSGKVRDLHMLNDGRLLLVASDRISAFDVVLPTAIPDKGRVLTGLSRFWFRETGSIIPNHLLDTDPAVFDGYVRDELRRSGYEPTDVGSLDALRGRIMICRPANVVPIEAVVRGYLSGSGWKEYRERGTVCGIRLPAGLRESDALPEPIFTPATKAEQGEHDQNVSFDEMIAHIAGPGGDHRGVRRHAADLAEAIRDRAVRLYRFGATIAAERGIILADTKFEFGQVDPDWTPTHPTPGRPASYEYPGPPQELILIDEVLTPDSSRFWDAAAYAPGGPQASFDKQFVRDWLEAQAWDKTPPGPALPEDVVAGTRRRYIEAFERITGASFARYLEEDVIAP